MCAQSIFVHRQIYKLFIVHKIKFLNTWSWNNHECRRFTRWKWTINSMLSINLTAFRGHWTINIRVGCAGLSIYSASALKSCCLEAVSGVEAQNIMLDIMNHVMNCLKIHLFTTLASYLECNYACLSCSKIPKGMISCEHILKSSEI